MLAEVALTLAALALALSLGAVLIATRRRRDPTADARRRLEALVAEQTTASAEELKARLARMRADSLSILAEDERRIADERRQELAERERAAATSSPTHSQRPQAASRSGSGAGATISIGRSRISRPSCGGWSSARSS